jgi:hypothetical protein
MRITRRPPLFETSPTEDGPREVSAAPDLDDDAIPKQPSFTFEQAVDEQFEPEAVSRSGGA